MVGSDLFVLPHLDSHAHRSRPCAGADLRQRRLEQAGNPQMNHDDLVKKGFVRAPDGSWSKPHNNSLGGLQGAFAKSNEQRKVAGSNREEKVGGNCLARGPGDGPCCRVTFVAYRRRFLDSDRLFGGNMTALRDAVAATLGLDDSDKVIAWEYHQVQTHGREGTSVKIEIL